MKKSIGLVAVAAMMAGGLGTIDNPAGISPKRMLENSGFYFKRRQSFGSMNSQKRRRKLVRQNPSLLRSKRFSK